MDYYLSTLVQITEHNQHSDYVMFHTGFVYLLFFIYVYILYLCIYSYTHILIHMRI